MFGGMSQATTASLALEYSHAADLIINAVRRDEVEDYRVANAALFLYRHACELLLKAAIDAPVRGHGLAQLTKRFVAIVKTRYNQDVPDWIVQRLKELDAIDPGSTAFRYGEYSVGGETYVDLHHLQAAMWALCAALGEAVGNIRLIRERGL